MLCKEYAPTMTSVSPDGYWYLLGGRWNGKFYAAANTFLNGDAPNAKTFTHSTEHGRTGLLERRPLAALNGYRLSRSGAYPRLKVT